MATSERDLLSSIGKTAQYGKWLFSLVSSPSVVEWQIIPPPRTNRLGELFSQIDALSSRRDRIPGYSFRPTRHAKTSAKIYLLTAFGLMREQFPAPQFVLDGERGIVIKWTHGERTVRLNCFADPSDPDYIYYENGEYDVEDSITANKLKTRLEWLLHEPQPAR